MSRKEYPYMEEKDEETKEREVTKFILGILLSAFTIVLLVYIAQPFWLFGESNYGAVSENEWGTIIINTLLPDCLLVASLYYTNKLLKDPALYEDIGLSSGSSLESFFP